MACRRILVVCIAVVVQSQICAIHPADMAKRTVLNEQYQGLLEAMAIPAEVHERDGSKFASFGSAVPIHRCTEEQVRARAAGTHHYCGLFTEQTLAPLTELAYVRVDHCTAEKVFINRNKRILLTSSDGLLAQWRCAPTFESGNRYMAGTPVVNADGNLLSLVTARRGNHYAISNIDGAGGYFDTTEPWNVITVPEGHLIYGNRTFPSRAALREHVGSLPPPAAPFAPALMLAPTSRLSLVAASGRQVAHVILDGVIVKGVEYL